MIFCCFRSCFGSSSKEQEDDYITRDRKIREQLMYQMQRKKSKKKSRLNRQGSRKAFEDECYDLLEKLKSKKDLTRRSSSKSQRIRNSSSSSQRLKIKKTKFKPNELIDETNLIKKPEIQRKDQLKTLSNRRITIGRILDLKDLKDKKSPQSKEISKKSLYNNLFGNVESDQPKFSSLNLGSKQERLVKSSIDRKIPLIKITSMSKLNFKRESIANDENNLDLNSEKKNSLEKIECKSPTDNKLIASEQSIKSRTSLIESRILSDKFDLTNKSTSRPRSSSSIGRFNPFSDLTILKRHDNLEGKIKKNLLNFKPILLTPKNSLLKQEKEAGSIISTRNSDESDEKDK